MGIHIKLRMRSALRTATALVLTCVGATTLPGRAEAGLFDEIGRVFSEDRDAVYDAPSFERRRSRDNDPLSLTVRPRLSRPKQTARPSRTQQSAKPAQQSIRKAAKAPRTSAPSKMTPEMAAHMDPDQNPTWYLDDPTLRPGDIVVLKGEVLVFKRGRLPYSRNDFATLGKSRLSAAEKEKLRSMAGVRVDPKITERPRDKALADARGKE